jgi:hypothetical protein
MLSDELQSFSVRPKETAVTKLEFKFPSFGEGLAAIVIIPAGCFIYDQCVRWIFHVDRDLSHTLSLIVFCSLLWYLVCFVRRKPTAGNGIAK